MPSVYCPHSACGSKIAYEAVKPSVCPRCQRSFASAFAPKVEAAKAKPVRSPRPRAEVVDTETEANLMTPYDPSAPQIRAAPIEEPEDEAYDDGTDPREARRIADELAASINLSISEDLGDDAIFSFGDLVQGSNRGRGARSRR